MSPELPTMCTFHLLMGKSLNIPSELVLCSCRRQGEFSLQVPLPLSERERGRGGRERERASERDGVGSQKWKKEAQRKRHLFCILFTKRKRCECVYRGDSWLLWGGVGLLRVWRFRTEMGLTGETVCQRVWAARRGGSVKRSDLEQEKQHLIPWEWAEWGKDGYRGR